MQTTFSIIPKAKLKEVLHTLNMQPDQILVIWNVLDFTTDFKNAFDYYYSINEAVYAIEEVEKGSENDGKDDQLSEYVCIEISTKEELGFTGWF